MVIYLSSLHIDSHKNCNHLCSPALKIDQEKLAAAIFAKIIEKTGIHDPVLDLLKTKYHKILPQENPKEEDDSPILVAEEEEKKAEDPPSRGGFYCIKTCVSDLKDRIEKINNALGFRWLIYEGIRDLNYRQSSLEALLKENPQSWKNNIEAKIRNGLYWVYSTVSSSNQANHT